MSYAGRLSAKRISGTGSFYAGYVAYDATRALLPGNGGGYGYFIANNVTLPLNSWTLLAGGIRGEGSALHQFPPGTRFIKPLIVMIGSGTTRIDAFSIQPQVPSTIICQLSTSNFPAVTGRANIYTWTPGDCGGVLPTPAHVGMLSKAVACGNDEDWLAINAGEQSGPGFSFWLGSLCTPTVMVNASVVYILR